MKRILITNKEDLHMLMEYAKQLPQDASTPIYQNFDGQQNTTGGVCLTVDAFDPVTVFNAHPSYYHSHIYPRYYVSSSKVGDDGKILPEGVWERTLMMHRKYARYDVPIKHVSFEVVGFKRKSTGLPAGVLIDNVQFTTE